MPGISTQTSSGQPGPDPGSLDCLSAAAAARSLSRTSKNVGSTMKKLLAAAASREALRTGCGSPKRNTSRRRAVAGVASVVPRGISKVDSASGLGSQIST